MPPRPSRTARLVRLTALAASGLAALAGASSAAAWSYNGTAGVPGGLSSLGPVLAADLYAGGSTGLTLLTQVGPVAGRSGATAGAQDVVLQYSVQRWNGAAWVQVTRQRTITRIPAGVRAVRLPALYVRPTVARGHLRVVQTYAWGVAGTSTLLGFSAVVPDRAGDLVCVTPHRPCAAVPGSVRLGRQYRLGGGW